MATITGFTAARMLAIEAASVVDGDVVSGNLILTKHDGSTINAGSVIGPTGAPGVSQAQLDTFMLDQFPIGSIIEYIEPTAPNIKWLLMQGQTIVNGQTTYATLWSKLPASMKSGSSIIMPDTRGKVAVTYNSADTDFDTIGEVGGSKTVTLTQAQLPNATITINPPATAVTGSSGNDTTPHQHAPPSVDTVYMIGDPTEHILMGSGAISRLMPQGDTAGENTGIPLTNHVHSAGSYSVDIASFQSGALGSGAATSIVQSYVVFQRMIKVL